MAIYYIDQTVPNGTVLPLAKTTVNVAPAAVDGDFWYFCKGKYYKELNLGVLNLKLIDLGTKTITVGCYDPATTFEWTNQLDPFERWVTGKGWPTETEILDNYAILSKGVLPSSPGNDTPLNNRSVIGGIGKGAIVRGLCVQDAWYAGMESTNITNGNYLIEKCIVRRIGTDAVTLSGVTSWGIGIRHNFASAGKMQVNKVFIEEVGEDGIWGAQTLGTQNPVVTNTWIRKVGWSLGAPASAHADCIQFQNPNDFTIKNCILDHILLRSLDSLGLAKVGNDIILAGSGTSVGGTIDSCVIITNSEATNLGTATGGIMRNCLTVMLTNPYTVARNGWDDGGIGFVNPGSGHLFQSNVFIMERGRQNGSNGFMFGETDWLANSQLIGNIFIGNGNATKNACFDTRTTTTGLAQNNVFIDFENAMVQTTNPLATELGNAFINTVRKRSSSKSGGSDLGVNASSFVTTLTAALKGNYRSGKIELADNSSLVGVGVHSGYRIDGKGKTYFNPPTVGPYEIERPRTPRT